MSGRINELILHIAESASPGSKVNGVLPVQLAPHQILAALSLEFADALRVPQVAAAVAEVERQMRAAHAEVVTLFIKPQTGAVFKETARLRVGGSDGSRLQRCNFAGAGHHSRANPADRWQMGRSIPSDSTANCRSRQRGWQNPGLIIEKEILHGTDIAIAGTDRKSLDSLQAT